LKEKVIIEIELITKDRNRLTKGELESISIDISKIENVDSCKIKVIEDDYLRIHFD